MPEYILIFLLLTFLLFSIPLLCLIGYLLHKHAQRKYRKEMLALRPLVSYRQPGEGDSVGSKILPSSPPPPGVPVKDDDSGFWELAPLEFEIGLERPGKVVLREGDEVGEKGEGIEMTRKEVTRKAKIIRAEPVMSIKVDEHTWL